MTVQVSQIQSLEPRLLPDAYTQNASNNSFHHYLENEQKRLALMFSPFGQFNFNSWFSYPDFFTQPDTSTNKVNLFSGIDLTASETAAKNVQTVQSNVNNEPAFSQCSVLTRQTSSLVNL